MGVFVVSVVHALVVLLPESAARLVRRNGQQFPDSQRVDENVDVSLGHDPCGHVPTSSRWSGKGNTSATARLMRAANASNWSEVPSIATASSLASVNTGLRCCP